MKLKRIQVDQDGQIETVWMLSNEQYHSLINHAINDLLMKGIIETIDLSPEELQKMQKESFAEVQKTFLMDARPEDLPQA